MITAYRVEVTIKDKTRALTPFSWHFADHGRPTEANLGGFVARYNRSFQAGGSNEHVGVESSIVSARLIHQRSGDVIAEWNETDG